MFSALQADDTKDRTTSVENILSLLSLGKQSSDLGPAVCGMGHHGLLNNSIFLCRENSVFSAGDPYSCLP